MQVKIDTRPLPIVILARWWRFPVFVILALLIRYFYVQEPPPGLSVEGFRALIVFVTCLILWVTQLLPLPVTGLFALALPVLLNIMPASQAFRFFASDSVFFIMGVFILAAALLKSGLSTRIALHLLKRGSESPKRLIFQVMLTAALLSFIMSEHAVAAMMFPVLLVIVKRLGITHTKSSYARTLFLAMAWGCVIGGIATMLGGARVPLAVGILQENTGQTITFLEWTQAMIPLVVALFVFCYFLLTRYFKIDVDTVSDADSAIEEQIRDCGRLVMEEKFLGLLIVGAVAGWIFAGPLLGMATISILAVVFLFMFRVVEWRDLQEKMEWGVILMYGGAIAISAILSDKGAALWFADTYVVPHLGTPWMLIVVLSIITIILTEAMSNAAVVAVLLPIGITVAEKFELAPSVVVYAVASASGLAFGLPMSTPSIAIAYSSGYLKLKEVAVPATIMAAVSWIGLMLMAKFYWPLLGIHISK
jgi:sodium-dependent dicarboxylate transporter 2/3/5